jgi:hypothetical protein
MQRMKQPATAVAKLVYHTWQLTNEVEGPSPSPDLLFSAHFLG